MSMMCTSSFASRVVRASGSRHLLAGMFPGMKPPSSSLLNSFGRMSASASRPLAIAGRQGVSIAPIGLRTMSTAPPGGDGRGDSRRQDPSAYESGRSSGRMPALWLSFLASAGFTIYAFFEMTDAKERIAGWLGLESGKKPERPAFAPSATDDVDTGSRPQVYLDIEAGGKPLGRVVLELRPDVAPIASYNFLALCTGEIPDDLPKTLPPIVPGFDKTFKGSKFHRIIPGFMCQGGDITSGDGRGGMSIYGFRFVDENFKLKHTGPGILSMANGGPNTNSSQFFITSKATPHLDGRHVVFGSVVDGMDVVKSMEALGTRSGQPSKPVVVVACGTLDS